MPSKDFYDALGQGGTQTTSRRGGSFRVPDETPIYDRFGLDTGSKNYSDALSAQLGNTFFEQYQANFYPIEDLVLASMDPSYYMQQANTSAEYAGEAFDRSLASQQRELNSFGIQLSDRDQQNVNRRNDIARAKAVGGSFNTAYSTTRDMAVSGLGLGRRA